MLNHIRGIKKEKEKEKKMKKKEGRDSERVWERDGVLTFI